jgi:hypothetical protein
MYSSGVIAIENDNYDYLAALMLKPKIRKGNEITSPMDVFVPGYVFQQIREECLPEITGEVYSIFPYGYILHFLKTKIGIEFSNEQKLIDKFDIFEYLIALTYIDSKYPDLSKQINYVPVGRYFYTNSHQILSILRTQNPNSRSLTIDTFFREGIHPGVNLEIS